MEIKAFTKGLIFNY